MITDQASYVLGEPIEITVTAHNSSTSPVTIGFPSTLQAQYRLDNVFTTPEVGATVLTSVTVPAGGVYDWRFDHSWNEYDLSIGSHSVVGILSELPLENRYTLPQAFEVTAPQPVVNDVLIDFETYPNGDPTTGFWQHAYAQWGVEFRSEGGKLNLDDNFGLSTVLHTPSGTHPFNIVADFAMPVYAVSVDVGTAAGETVSMSAYGTAGNLLGTVESAPISNYPHLVGPLEFSSDAPIASVKWLASQSNAAVKIDNLRLEVDGIAATVPGDYDFDGDVDGADFVVWQTNFPTATGAMLSDGDADGDGDVDGADFVIWQTNFPFTPSPGASPVPEPDAFIPMLLFGAALAMCRWLCT